MPILLKAQARTALRAALDTRRQAGIPSHTPISIFDFAEKLEIEVKFAGINSFGGMWVKRPKTILIPSQRPAGRQAFTCAHELGHWYFDHGTKVDPVDCQEVWVSDDAEELIANAYAGFLLMPIWAVKRSFERRLWTIEDCSPLQAHTISGQLGVSYEALIKHACYSLATLSRHRCNSLLTVTPKMICEQLLPRSNGSRLLIVDTAWEEVPIDLQVGEFACVPKSAQIIGKCVKVIASNDESTVIQAVSPGLDRVSTMAPVWSAHVRVCRKDFEGRCTYRHLEDPE